MLLSKVSDTERSEVEIVAKGSSGGWDACGSGCWVLTSISKDPVVPLMEYLHDPDLTRLLVDGVDAPEGGMLGPVQGWPSSCVIWTLAVRPKAAPGLCWELLPVPFCRRTAGSVGKNPSHLLGCGGSQHLQNILEVYRRLWGSQPLLNHMWGLWKMRWSPSAN